MSKKIISCQSAVKLDLQKLLNLTLSVSGQVVENQLSITQLNSNLQKINLKPLKNFEELNFKFLHQLKLGTNLNFKPLWKVYIVLTIKHTSDWPSSVKFSTLTNHRLNLWFKMSKKIYSCQQLSISCQTLPSKTAKFEPFFLN